MIGKRSHLFLFVLMAMTASIGCGGATSSGPSSSRDPGSLFVLTSPAFQDGGTLPVEYTCDGAGISPPLAWSNAPEGTVEFAILMTTLANDGHKWNWVLYGIPKLVSALTASSSGAGTFGLTSDGPELRYYPPCSQGPGPKTYTFTVYALSGAPTFTVPAGQVNGNVLTNAVSQLALASCMLSVTYARAAGGP
jgi:phosphatidylethanolamine-binding protein (PEBP) family uncharacterized protein